MANYTPNYGLHQWEPGDDFLRTDFNADFAKLDTALEAKADKTAVAQKADQSALEAVQSLAQGRCRVVTGSYIGDGTEKKAIHLGGQPKALIFPNQNVTVTVLPGASLYTVNITSTGFTVGQPGMAPFTPNQKDKQQFYLALM